MKTHNWIGIEDFCEITNTSYSTTRGYVKSKHPKAFRNLRGLEVDYNYFKRRWEFHEKIVNEAHIFYYALTKYYSDAELIKLMAKYSEKRFNQWRDCIKNQLFMPSIKPYTDPTINQCVWDFWKYWRSFFILALKQRGLKYNIKKIEGVINE